MSEDDHVEVSERRDDPRTSDAEPPEWTPGQLIARRYLLERPLGGGSTGEVWLAEDRLLRKSVALKALRRELAQNRETVHRFLREVALAHSVTHRNVIRIYDTGEEQGLPFFTMEFLQGQTLEALLEEDGEDSAEGLAFSEIRQIAFDVLDGMEAAHRVGIVHRDLKPGNVMLTHRGAIVTDFGVAGIEEVSEAPNAAAVRSLVRTEAGTIFGSPAYMAPELWEGAPATVQSDLYAFGVMVYQMVAGRLPYEAQSPAAYLQKLNEGPPPSVRSMRRDTPWSFVRLVRRCMATAPEDRPVSAAAAANLIAPLRDKARRRALVVTSAAAIGIAAAYAVRTVPTHGALGLPNADAQAQLVAAVGLFDVGESAAALRSIERLTQDAPDSAALHFWQATILEDLGAHRDRQERCAQVERIRGDASWIALAQQACQERYTIASPARRGAPYPSLAPLYVQYDLLPELEASAGTDGNDPALDEEAKDMLARLEAASPAGPWDLGVRRAISRIDMELALGRFGEANAHMQQLLDEASHIPLVTTRASWMARIEGDVEQAHTLAVTVRATDRTPEIELLLQEGRLDRAWSLIETAPSTPSRDAWIETWCGFAWKFEVVPPPPQCRALTRGLAAASWNGSSITDTALEDFIAEQERIEPCRRNLVPSPRLTHATSPFELRLAELALESALCRRDPTELEQAQSLASRLSALAPTHPWLSLVYARVLDERGKDAQARNQRMMVGDLWSDADDVPRVRRLRDRLASDAGSTE